MSPTISAKPVFYTLENPGSPVKASLPPIILFKFNDGAWQTCRKKIEEIIKSEFPNVKYDIYSSEKEYDEFLKSENTLLKILSLVSLVCVIVCVFGFVSMVSLTCEERRKEIAIRKINGATVKDILDIFFKEYLLLLIVGALIAFPSGYLIMKPWLENYVLQTEISAWIYILILLVLIVILALCVGGKVYRASRENPVESIKN
jgi:ABC-type antimicrobial peptide transport system permease subunit